MTVDLAYSLHGPDSAPVLVLLHGMGAESDRSSWDPVVPLLAHDFRLVVPDLRGHGASPRPGSYLLMELAEDVEGLLDRLGVRDATVVGHSMGGAVTQVMAYGRPELVARFVLEDTPPPVTSYDPLFDPAPAADLSDPTEYDLVIRPALLRELGRPAPGWAMRASMTRQPALVIGGGPASYIDQCRLECLARTFPQGTFTTIEAGHNIHPTQPEEFVRILRTWLDDHPLP